MRFPQAGVVLEGCPMEKDNAGIITAGSGSVGSLLAYRDRVNLGAMARDLTNRVAAVCCYAMTKTFFSVADSNNTLRISVPRYVVDAACYDVVFAYMTYKSASSLASLVTEPKRYWIGR